MGSDLGSSGVDWPALRARVGDAVEAAALAADAPFRLKLLLGTGANAEPVTVEAASRGANAPGVPETVVVTELAEFVAVLNGKKSIEQSFLQAKIRVEGEFKLALALARALEKHAASAKVAPGAQRYPSRRRESERLAASRPPLTAVERRARPSVAEFRDRYLATGTPLVITGAVDHFRFTRASWRELRDALRGSQGLVRRGDYVSAAFSTEREVSPTLIADFVDQILLEGPTPAADSVPPYLGNNPCPESLASWWEFPEYFSTDEYAPDMPRLWLGPGGTVTPLHRDSADNLFVQIRGRKSVLLGSPDQWQKFYPWATSEASGLEGCEVNPESPDLARFPLFRDATLLRVELGPAELLFIPEGWFHHVRALEPQLSLSFWTRTARGSEDPNGAARSASTQGHSSNGRGT